MDDLELGLYAPDQVGFRLLRLEVFNWGTFDGTVWTLDLDGGNGLLTGDIGSGKSTLVDALTTLLVPRVEYNKAAGAQFRERTVSSYVAGHYKAERADLDSHARPVALRDASQYSVLLAVFGNAALGQSVTLVQMFWHADQSGRLNRMFVVADGQRSIAEHFSGFGQIRSLKARLRRDGDQIHDSFEQYSRDFRRRFGIDHKKALELFHQTVSMKSVGNLTDFVRQHMLEPPDVAERLRRLIEHYDDLAKAHQAVVTATEQVAVLAPLVADLDNFAGQHEAHDANRRNRDLLESWFPTKERGLLTARIRKRRAELAKLDVAVATAESGVERAHERVSEVKDAIRENGGDRLARLESEIGEQRRLRDPRKDRARQYERLCASLALTPATDEDSLLVQQDDLTGQVTESEARYFDLENQLSERAVQARLQKDRLQKLDLELKSLMGRDSSIDGQMMQLRQLICEGAGLHPSDLPYAGELLRVTDERWEPAAERLLHGFGVSMLVPDEHYSVVSAWIDRNNLRGRLVYFRVGGNRPAPQVTDDRSLTWMLEVKPNSRLGDWLWTEVVRRFDLVCARNDVEFQQAERALSIHGQVKHSGTRHEKDDRRQLGDRRNYVLGWDNAAKRQAISEARDEASTVLSELDEIVAGLRTERSVVNTRLGQLRLLSQSVKSFAELDWRTCTASIVRLEREQEELRGATDVLRELHSQLLRAQDAVEEAQGNLRKLNDRSSGVKVHIGIDEARCGELDRQLGELPTRLGLDGLISGEVLSADESLRIAGLVESQLGEKLLTPESCDRVQREVRSGLSDEIDRLAKILNRARERIVKRMGEFKARWQLAAQEMDVAVDAGDEYRGVLARLVEDDLPRFEATFKRLLQENAINEVIGFRAALELGSKQIRERVDTINASLHDINYQPHTYVRLELERTRDVDVRQFLADLKAFTDDALATGSGEQYSETKFLQVKELIDRFKGRQGRAEEDRRWTNKVTDVRYWFTFAASERLRSDGSEHEHYSDSGGKSGGQKEKLAYTILAASLAYQFGLVHGQTHSRTFRFVVIDEAFGRGSDESARFGLELFKRLDLQLLVVTPKQKIHVIEPYVGSVAFVHNDGGSASKLRNYSIEQYRAEKAVRV